jgi:hypothetical protein
MVVSVTPGFVDCVMRKEREVWRIGRGATI